MTLTEIETLIATAATRGTAEVAVDGQNVKFMTLAELMAWRRELQAAESTTRAGFGLRFQQITPVYR